MKKLIWILLFGAVTSTVHSRPTQTQTKFCDLVRDAEKYNGKEVTVRATHHYSFEVSTFYCIDCLEKGRAWLDFSDDLDDASQKALRRAPKGTGIINLTVTGTFMSGGHYGHLGLKYGFLARRVSDVSVLLKGTKKPDEERAIEEKWACGGKNPK
jgi:hypothetical protein